ncbi:hypothetical protein [Saccharopolyspora erythraea]|uniref:hypothetical protein n=1 Tax=Saccharopolyspora erythraea TaxID=1836 RepID=UPI001BACCDB3|nr:hypothetical protein [Saccharopolyspora erythraea]
MRTFTALDRLHDVFPVLADDLRLEIRFAVAAGSRFAGELADHLRRSHMRVVDWSAISAGAFDLAISPSSNGALHELPMPVMTLPHGAGYHKKRATDAGFTDDVSGLSREQLVHDDRVVPSVIGLSHHKQLTELAASCPEALERARVIGDPCFDHLRASLPMREHYRTALGTGERKLVVVCSTWGTRSAFGRQGELAGRLAAVLPPEEYQVALVLHPNIAAHHSGFMVDLWTRGARAQGVVRVPPDRGWRATLVAADVVISDHGSLALYAAALGIPLLLAEFGESELVPGTPITALGDLAPRLSRDGDLRAQIDNARPLPSQEVPDAFDFVGRSPGKLREVIYDALDLALPPWPVHPEPADVFTP